MKDNNEDNIGKQIIQGITLGSLGLLILFLVIGSMYTVGAGERGIELTWGRAENIAAQPGFNTKIPIAQSVVKMTVQTQKYETAASAASSDLQVVSSKIAVNYHLNPEGVVDLYKEIGINYQDRVIQPAVQEAVKAATATFTAEELITQRPVVKEKIQLSLAERMRSRGIIVEDVNIVDFDFSAQFNEAIEQKVTAEQQKLKAANDLERIKIEAQQVAAQGQGRADAVLAEAKAEAEKIRLVQEQLARSSNYVELQKWQRWDGKLPQYMMTMGGEVTPLINVPSLGTSSTN